MKEPTISALRHGPVLHDDATTTFRVWAPHAEHVDVLTDTRATPMETDGAWHVARVAAAHGDDYCFRLDGGQERPDPAARWLPYGVHAPARVLDPRTFAWTDAGWRAAPLPAAVVYELHIGTFTDEGTFDAVIPRLRRLADLGVTHVEVMPVNGFNGDRGWGYDGVSWYAVHQPYGGPEGFARFVNAAHAEGLAVVLDVVYNHLGPSGNYLPEFGPYLTDHYATPWGDALNLDGPDSDPVRAFIIDNARWWLQAYHVDALRLDAVHGLVDTSAVHLLAELGSAVEEVETATGRPRQLIAESDRCDPATIRPRAAGGLGMHAQWSDDLHHAIHTAVTGEREGYYVDYDGLPDVAEAYRRGFLFDGSRYSHYRRRTLGAPLGDTPGHRLVTCIQNHDQVGNRAAGDRLTALVEPALVRVAIVLLCASPTTPMLFMGEEYGETRSFQYFTSHPEPELAEAVRTGRAAEFTAFADFSGDVPDPQDPATRDTSILDWSAASRPDGRARYALWAALLRLRREHPALGNARRDLVEVVSSDEEHLVLIRHDECAPAILLTVNLAAHERPCPSPAGRWRLILSSQDVRYGGTAAAPAAHTPCPVPPLMAALWAPVD